MADIIVFGEDYGKHPSAMQHLVNRLTSDHRIVWMNSMGLRRPCLSRHDLKRIATKAKEMLSSHPNTTTPNALFPVHQPLVLPFPASPLARRINRFLLHKQINHIINMHHLQHPILLTSLPSATDVIHPALSKIVYYCGDDFSALEGVDHDAVALMEQQLVRRSNLVIAASESLASKFPAYKTRHLPHGVDVDLFTQTTEKPALYRGNRPRACFYGSLATWVRIDWIAHAAAMLPEWDFVLIGDAKCDLSALDRLDNVILTGRKSHHELVAYASHADVLLMPFADNAQIQHCNPLKLTEYLATGKPIVSTDFPAIEPYRDLLYLADSAETFTAQIIAAASETNNQASYRREAVAAQDWNQQAKQLEEWLCDTNSSLLFALSILGDAHRRMFGISSPSTS